MIPIEFPNVETLLYAMDVYWGGSTPIESLKNAAEAAGDLELYSAYVLIEEDIRLEDLLFRL